MTTKQLEEAAREYWKSIEWDGKRDAPALFAAFALTKLREQLADLERRGLLVHGGDCAHYHAWNPRNKICDCGLDEMKRELEEK